MFFALSTGRAGSRTLAAILSQSATCTCLHEPHPQLIEESARYRYGELETKELVRLLRASRREAEDRVYGETSNRLALVVPVLREAFPEARYVWLVRDGRDVVSSAVQRGWFDTGRSDYPPNEWERWRLRGDLVADVSEADWASWTAFRRVCWLWAYTNRLIEHDLADGGVERPRIVRLERLPDELDGLADHLGIERGDWIVGRLNARGAESEVAPLERVNVVDRVWGWQDWTAEQREDFEALCAPVMDALYPEWCDRAGRWRQLSVKAESTKRITPDSGLAAVRADLAELKLIRGDLQSIVAVHRRAVADWDARLQSANQVTAGAVQAADELREQLAVSEQSMPRLREALARSQEEAQQLRERLGAATDELRSRDKAWRTARERLIKLEASPAYRLGIAATSSLRRLSRGRLGEQAVTRAYERLQSNERVRTVLGFDQAVPGTAVAQGDRSRAAPPVPGGRALDPEVAAGLPIVLVVLVGLDGDAVDRFVDEVAAAQMAQPTFRPLFVIDTDRFGLLREHGYLFEYLPPEGDLVHSTVGTEYGAFVAARVTRIVEAYRVATVIVTPTTAALVAALPGSGG